MKPKALIQSFTTLTCDYICSICYQCIAKAGYKCASCSKTYCALCARKITNCLCEMADTLCSLRSRKGRSIASAKVNSRKNMNANYNKNMIEIQLKSNENATNTSYNDNKLKLIEESLKQVLQNTPSNLNQILTSIKEDIDKINTKLSTLEGNGNYRSQLLNPSTDRPVNIIKPEYTAKLESEITEMIKEKTKQAFKKYEDDMIEFIQYQMDSLTRSKDILQEAASKAKTSPSKISYRLCAICCRKNISIKKCTTCKSECCMNCRCKCSTCSGIYCSRCFKACKHCSKKLCISCSQSCIICGGIKCTKCCCRDYCVSKLQVSQGNDSIVPVIYAMLGIPKFSSYMISRFYSVHFQNPTNFECELCSIIKNTLKLAEIKQITIDNDSIGINGQSTRSNLELFISKCIEAPLPTQTQYTKIENSEETRYNFISAIKSTWSSPLVYMICAIVKYRMKCPFCSQEYAKFEYSPIFESTCENKQFPKGVIGYVDYITKKDSTTCTVCNRTIGSSLLNREILYSPPLLLVSLKNKESNSIESIEINDDIIEIGSNAMYCACGAIGKSRTLVKTEKGWKMYENNVYSSGNICMTLPAEILIMEKVCGNECEGKLEIVK